MSGWGEPAGVKSGGRRIDGRGGAQRWQRYSHSAP